MLPGESQGAAVVVAIGVKVQDADALHGAYCGDDALDLPLITTLAEVGDCLEERWSHLSLPRAEGAVEVDGGAYEG